jgi:hypothetical protein
MALIDDRSELASAYTLTTGATGRQLVGDVMDLRAATVAPNAATGLADLHLVVVVAQAFTSGGAATVAFEVCSDAQGAIATDGSATRHYATGQIPVATLVAGALAMAVRLSQHPPAERYLGLLANVGTAALTAGKVSAYLTNDPPTWRALADTIN